MASRGIEEFLIRFMTHISGQHFIHLRLDWYRYMGVKWAAPRFMESIDWFSAEQIK